MQVAAWATFGHFRRCRKKYIQYFPLASEILNMATRNISHIVPPLPVIQSSARKAPAESSIPQSVHNLQRLADWMDTAFEIPGTGIRFGLDALIGLVPGMGDTVTSLIALYIVGAASRMGVPRVTLIRMITNVGIDWLVGIIPFLGDVFDVYWKANQRNMAILRGHLGDSARERQRSKRADWAVLLALGLLLTLVIAGGITFIALAVKGIGMLFGG